MDLGIKNKVALLTGASSGLGFASAEVLLQEGAKVAICSRNAAKVEAAVQRLKERVNNPDHVFGMVADYNDPVQAKAFVKATQEKFGGIDILVCSSGGPAPGTATQFEAAQYQQAMQNNCLSFIDLTLSLVPTMRGKKWGRIVYITSSAAVQPVPSLVLSNVARTSLHAFAKSLSVEIAHDGVTVNCVMPGKLNTDRIMDLVRISAGKRGATLQEEMSQDFSKIPAGRYGQPRELGTLVGFLCSDCASYITGSAIAVDGGAIAGLR